MRLGFVANYTPERAAFAQETGFTCLQLSAWPGSALDPETITPEGHAAIRRDLEARGIRISGLGYYPNLLDPDAAAQADNLRRFRDVMRLAAEMGVPLVSTIAGRDPERTVPENMPRFADLFGALAEEAQSLGIRIAIENCPLMDRLTLKAINLAISPEIWAEMFRLVPSPTLGLEFDPSHLAWQGIDLVAAVAEFGPRILHVHAKDVEINKPMLARAGIYGQVFGQPYAFGHGWWRARLPGWGMIDWPALITALHDAGYAGDMNIEHEDDVFARDLSVKVFASGGDVVDSYSNDKIGLRLGYKALSRYLDSGEN